MPRSEDPLMHGLVTSFLLVVIRISKFLLLSIAEVICDHFAIYGYVAALGYMAVLHPDETDLREGPTVCTIIDTELRDHCEGLVGIDREISRGPGPKKVLSPVEVAAVFVTDPSVSLSGSVITTISSLAPRLPLDGANMWRISSRDAVALPDVHFIAAGTVASNTTVLVCTTRHPAFAVSFSVDEF